MGSPPEAWASLPHRILFTHSLHTERMPQLDITGAARYRHLSCLTCDAVHRAAQDAPCHAPQEPAITVYFSSQGWGPHCLQQMKVLKEGLTRRCRTRRRGSL